MAAQEPTSTAQANASKSSEVGKAQEEPPMPVTGATLAAKKDALVEGVEEDENPAKEPGNEARKARSRPFSDPVALKRSKALQAKERALKDKAKHEKSKNLFETGMLTRETTH